ncbi:MAG: hypothetical protein CYPHOPRED_003775 [Cyphobasidiales sp. Tagirdzhanova-0007]|nr:MAG: hypothetical protein CYPHOPRED_003775 [Cyphobasidiales sp. Tagirdzhanova-0007]
MAILPSTSTPLRFTGHQNLRYRILLSILSQRSILITSIRADSENPGIRDYEVSFLRLIERLSNGTLVEISYTGTEIYVKPGLMAGGTIQHTCPDSRAVGWFLEPILVLGLFGKTDLKLTLKGITTNNRDVSADTLRTSYLPHLSAFLPATVTAPLELRIVKRGFLPSGGGEITYLSPSIRNLKPGYSFTQPGVVNKIRGIAHSVRVSPAISQRLVNGAKEVLSPLCGDCRIYADVYRGTESGKSPGFAITLVATSTTTALHSSEAVSGSSAASSDVVSEQNTPEELGAQAAYQLLHNISQGACIDKGIEWMACLLMALGSEDVGKVRIASPADILLIQQLRDMKDFLGVMVKIRQHDEEDTYTLSCVGIGYSNIAKKTAILA